MLQLINVRKTYKTAGFEQIALDDVSMAFRDNEFVAILGPSGSGKTTLLNIVGGLDHYDSGDLIIDGVSTKKYRDRDWDTYRNNRIGFVFQSYNLIPHQTVLANVELALTLSGVNKAERRERARKALEEVGLAEHAHKKPNQLSGGQMQRVAVARALINDPEILLADEPTGALDSKTSVQIMDLLVRIASDRLVIMVTHNPELAEQYANRTISLSDGHVVADSNPLTPVEETLTTTEKIRRSGMSFLTAIALSFSNLMTKKGRTLMTAFAGSIGIIGVAAILSLANGVNNYIKNVEENTLSVYPLSIESTGTDLTSMLLAFSGGGGGDEDGEEIAEAEDGEQDGDSALSFDEAEDGTVREFAFLSNMLSRIGSNDLKALKTFLDSEESGVAPHVNAIEYRYSVTPQIYAWDTAEEIRQVHPDDTFASIGLGTFGGSAGMGTMGMGAGLFSQLVEDTELVESQYQIAAGRWPEEYNECVLVVSEWGGISDYALYLMGLRDPEELDDMVAALANGEEVVVPESTLNLTFEQILDVKFHLVYATDYYSYETDYGVWTDKRDDEAYMEDLVATNSETLEVVGILKPDPTASTYSLRPGLYYSASLVTHIIEKAADSQIVKEQLAQPGVNVFTGKRFSEEEETEEESPMGDFDLGSLITVDEDAIANAFEMDPNAFNIQMGSMLDPAAAAEQMPPMPEPDFTEVFANLDIEVPPDQVNALLNQVIQGYFVWYATSGYPFTPEDLGQHFGEYLADPTVQTQLLIALNAIPGITDIQGQVQQQFAVYMQSLMQGYMTTLMGVINQQIQTSMLGVMGQLQSNLANAMSFDTEAFRNAFQFNMNEEELTQLMTTMFGRQERSFDANLRSLGYADFAKPAHIDIYPRDFESKQAVIDILDDYNKRMEDNGQEEKAITYTDFVGVLMNSVTEIINMISYVLVVFVSISLVVSSIMIGVITYISVLERKKEIGILRSIGASKGDIGRVFNAETLIVGFVAGLMGVLITFLATIPANALVLAQFDIVDIAILPLLPACALVVISMVLTFLAGLIPSSVASRKDPVEALRSE
ncbi:MAG: ABC transporter ATP-binding protein/permease [Coriobacteriales bacterium]|jgi:ABC-type lipoprotein export system ATPase subunit|nr:ABC transporter ATP-binding protein/permease [Coriobacteriales bacterium]